MKNLRTYAGVLGLVTVMYVTGASTRAQSALPSPSESPTATDDEKQKEKEALEKKAAALLEQVITDVQMLKLPENRVRVQITAGDLLWKRNESRARSMFALAADGINELGRSTDNNSRQFFMRLRQELVMTAAQHDAPLAYQLIASTRSTTTAADADPNNPRANMDVMLEQNLLGLVARLDPKLAAQKAEEALAKDQFPASLTRVLAELQVKDKEAFTKLSEKVLSKLETSNMLSATDAGTLALSLLQPGPRAADKPTDTSAAAPATTAAPVVIGRGPSMAVLSQSSFTELLGVVIDAALKTTASNTATQRGGNQRGNVVRRGPGGLDVTLTDAQIEQNNARRLLMGLQPMLPQIDQYAGARATAVRQKLTEVGGSTNPRDSMTQLNTLMRQGTTDSLLQAAPIAPPQVQNRLYQQAAMKALDEGNVDQARQIANEHLDQRTRDSVLQRVDFQVMANKMDADNMDQLRQALAQLHSDDDRIDLLLQLAGTMQAKDKTVAVKLLTEAQRLTNRHATGYRQFEQQLAVADALSNLDVARSFDTLDPGINQLNELLSAAAVLSGFEVGVFRDGELPLDPTNQLTSMVGRFAQEISVLATKDFERAENSANKFQLTEPRILARLSIARNVLGGRTVMPTPNSFRSRPPAFRAQD